MDVVFLIENLNHNNPKVREKAALEIERYNLSITLIPLLNTYFNNCYYIIPRIIGKIGSSEAVSPLIEINALPLKQSFIHPDLRPKEGFLESLDGPGLGIILDEDVVKEHKYN